MQQCYNNINCIYEHIIWKKVLPMKNLKFAHAVSDEIYRLRVYVHHEHQNMVSRKEVMQ